MRIPYKFKKIFVHQDAQHDEITRQVIGAFPDLPVQVVASENQFLDIVGAVPLTEGKKYIWLSRYKGDFIKYCPGATGTSQHYRCCNYLVINEATNCPIECSYCFLQGYVTNPAMTIYTNYQKIQEELVALSEANPGRIMRIGTGELTDSLALDPILRLSFKLGETVAQLPNIVLEMKTKTDHIDHLLEMPHRKMVISWSVNPQWIVGKVEHKAASLQRRLAAMKKINDAGFMIGLHFDPIIYYKNWREGYRELVQSLAEVVDARRIAWISMGSFRTPPPLKENIRLRFPKTPILAGEQVRGKDGKMRYIKPLRLEIYTTLYEYLKQAFGDPYVYFCMESLDLWEKVLGKTPVNSGEVDYYFAQHIFQQFPEFNFPEPYFQRYQDPIRQGKQDTALLWQVPVEFING